MKIAIFHNVPAGGAKRVVYEEVRWLSPRHQVDIYEYTSTDETFLDLKKLRVKIYRYRDGFPHRSHSAWSRFQRDLHTFINLKQVHQRIARDIHSRGYDLALIHPDKFTQAPFLLRYLRIPKIYFCEELLRLAYEPELSFMSKVSFYKKWYELITRAVRKHLDIQNARGADRILVASRFIQRQVKTFYHKTPLVCPLGVNTQIFKPYKLIRKKQLLFVGKPAAITGYPLLLEALKKLPQSLRPKIKIVDFINNKLKLSDCELAKIYSQSLATVCLSFNEPFGLTALESMACGTPVIAVKEGGYRETVIQGKTGWLIKRNAQALAEVIERLLKSPKLAVKIGQAGRKTAANWSWEKHCRLLSSYLKQVTPSL